MLLQPGTCLGPYEIVVSIGQGGMGEVYRALDTRLDRDVAIKVLPERLKESPGTRQRFQREARTVSQLQHPNICTLHDVGSEDGVDFLVLEYLEGETLAQRLRRGALTIQEVVELGTQIAAAIDTAHCQGVVHRDLKPSNVMLTSTGAKVLDFGLARDLAPAMLDADTQLPTATAPLTAEGSLVGTMPYMSPEQLEGKPADTRTDVWALGCVLHEAATGEPPFRGDNQASLISSIMTSDPSPPSQSQPLCPRRLDQAVRRCLEKDPDRRWQSVRDLSLELELLRSAPPDDGRTIRFSRSWAAAVAAIALLAMAGWWLSTRLGRPTPSESGRRFTDPQRLAVLPFDNFTGDPDLEPLALGIAEEVIRRFGVPTIARNTSFSYRGREVCEAADEMGVRFVLEGSLRSQDENLRVTAQVIECPRGERFWADTFDRTREDLFAVQDEVATMIAARAWMRIWKSVEATPGSPNWYRRQRTDAANAKAIALYEESARQAPDDPIWLGRLIEVQIQRLKEGWQEPTPEALAEIERTLDRCIAIDPARCHWAQGHYYRLVGRGEESVAAYRRTVQLTDRQASNLAWVGDGLSLVGRSEEAIRYLEEAIRVVPESWSFWRTAMARAHFSAGRYAEAVTWAKEAIQLNSSSEQIADAWEMLAASYGQLGEIERARKALAETLRLRPALSALWIETAYSTAETDHRARYLEGLRRAGFEGSGVGEKSRR